MKAHFYFPLGLYSFAILSYLREIMVSGVLWPGRPKPDALHRLELMGFSLLSAQEAQWLVVMHK
jgi:hypothetical protein